MYEKKKKSIAAITACVIAVAMLVGGTLTYFYQSKANNIFDIVVKGFVGHDDFNADTGNKDIYIENTGSAPVYVRIQLTEDFKISTAGGGEQVAMSGYAHTDAVVVSGIPAVGEHIHAPEGVGADVTSEDDASFHSRYFSWEMGGEGKDYLSAKDTTTYANATLEGVSFTYVAKDDFGNGVAAEGAVINTAPACEVITMADYGAKTSAEKAEFIGWVIDTEANGGWAYWSQMLLPGEATGLLLTQVNTQATLQNNDYSYTYDIHAVFEAVDETDKGLWTTSTQTTDENGYVVGNKEASEEAKELLGIAKEVYDGLTAHPSLAAKYFRELAATATADGDTALANRRLKQAEETEAAYDADPTLAETPLFDLISIDSEYKTAIAKYCDLDANGTVTVDEAKAMLSMNSLAESISYGDILTTEIMAYFPNVELFYCTTMSRPFDAAEYNLPYITHLMLYGVSSTNTVKNLDTLKTLQLLTVAGVGDSSTDKMDSIVIKDLPNLATLSVFQNSVNNISFSNLPKLTSVNLYNNRTFSGTLDLTGIPSATRVINVANISSEATTKCTIKRLESQRLIGTIPAGVVEEVYNASGTLTETINH